MLSQYQAFVRANQALTPEIAYIPLTQKMNRFQFVGGQIADGTLYAVVNSAEKMLKYGISTGETAFCGDFDKRDFKWTGGCVFDGNFYMFPRSENALLIYRIQTDAFETVPGPVYEGEHHYGGVCAPNGMIYQPPRNTNHILCWDLKTKTSKTIEINGGENCRYCGSVLHPNGHIYFIPERDFPVIKLHIETEEVRYLPSPKVCMCFDPTVAADGNIYGYSAEYGVLKIDTETDEAQMLYADCKIGVYGTKAGINGKLYSLPGYTNDVWEFDPFSGSLRKYDSITGVNQVHYAGGAVDTNGDIYALPVHADHILKISFQKYNRTIPESIYPFFRDCY